MSSFMIRQEHDEPAPPIDVSSFRGEWVALHPETHEIVGHGDGPATALRSISAKNFEPVLFFVPKSDAFFVGT